MSEDPVSGCHGHHGHMSQRCDFVDPLADRWDAPIDIRRPQS